MNLRRIAKGQSCQIRLAERCNHNPETVVLAHFRLMGISGIGHKSPDWLGAWSCSTCHAYVDSHKDAETQLAFCHGVFRTLNELSKLGVLLR
jgi:Protein of unknown function (DUF1364)